jgi:hypothetical protein
MEPLLPAQEPDQEALLAAWSPDAAAFPTEDERTADVAAEPVGAVVAASIVLVALLMLVGALLLANVH